MTTSNPAAAAVPNSQVRSRPPRNPVVADYSELLTRVRDAGLLRRRRGFYAALFAALMLALVATVAGVVALGDTWSQLWLAVVLGVLFAQVGFLAHEAAHREIFESGPANDRAGRVLGDLVVGISYAWWRGDHNPHHANPNTVGLDPSLARKAFAFIPEDAAGSRGFVAWFTRRQGYFFFPFLVLAGVNLHVKGLVTVFGRGRVAHRRTEIAMLLTRHLALSALVVTSMSPGKALAFAGVQLGVFGVCIAAAFVPNHIGMPVLPRGAKVDFLRRQVLGSRNITGGALVTTVLGGLNFQIEHHLFPSMPRPALRPARRLVREYCAERGISYTETSLLQAYGAVARYLNEVGLAAGHNPFRGPVAAGLGR
jgi:fatty acid desaturase